MEHISTTIESIATLLWPLIVTTILFTFRKSVQGLIDSARGRKFNIKIGDLELSVDEFSQQQMLMVQDLQTRVNKLQRQLEDQTKTIEPKMALATTPPAEEIT